MTLLSVFLQQGGGTQGGGASFWVMMLLMVGVMYLFMIRPQQKKAKLQKQFIEKIKKGDRIITTGGIHGKIVSVEDRTIVVESEGTKFKMEKASISAELSAPLNTEINTSV